MKIRNFFVLAIMSVLALSSFTKKGFDPLDITRKISENTYLDITEVTNLNWREYMSWNKKEFGKESKEYLATMLDMSVWQGEKFEAMQEYYLNDASYNNYPVVGVSYEQAVAYCTWRADRINEVMKLQKKKTALTFSCRLPTKAEWEKLANSDMYGNKKFNPEYHNLQKVTADGAVHENEITSPVESYTPTLNGYYNLIGNAAEMVAEKGIAKGGSWQHTNIGLTIERDYSYTAPTNWIGFRCVLEKK